MERREFLTSLAATTALACPLCTQSAKAAEWGYEGETGPDNWADLSGDYEACALGQAQSPIDLRDPIHSALSDLRIIWGVTKLNVENNGHTLQANVDPGSSTYVGDKRYALKQFHFHHPSEHLIEGEASPMEMHLVHAAKDGDLAVLGVMMVEGRRNASLQKVWELAPAEKGSKSSDGILLPAYLLPDRRSFYRYAGSLTTPPCSEVVTWTVFRDPIEVSAEQIQAFAALFHNNARPPQPQYRRFLLANF